MSNVASPTPRSGVPGRTTGYLRIAAIAAVSALLAAVVTLSVTGGETGSDGGSVAEVGVGDHYETLGEHVASLSPEQRDRYERVVRGRSLGG